jgi:hypothetical protein
VRNSNNSRGGEFDCTVTEGLLDQHSALLPHSQGTHPTFKHTNYYKIDERSTLSRLFQHPPTNVDDCPHGTTTTDLHTKSKKTNDTGAKINETEERTTTTKQQKQYHSSTSSSSPSTINHHEEDESSTFRSLSSSSCGRHSPLIQY